MYYLRKLDTYEQLVKTFNTRHDTKYVRVARCIDNAPMEGFGEF